MFCLAKVYVIVVTEGVLNCPQLTRAIEISEFRYHLIMRKLQWTGVDISGLWWTLRDIGSGVIRNQQVTSSTLVVGSIYSSRLPVDLENRLVKRATVCETLWDARKN